MDTLKHNNLADCWSFIDAAAAKPKRIVAKLWNKEVLDSRFVEGSRSERTFGRQNSGGFGVWNDEQSSEDHSILSLDASLRGQIGSMQLLKMNGKYHSVVETCETKSRTLELVGVKGKSIASEAGLTKFMKAKTGKDPLQVAVLTA